MRTFSIFQARRRGKLKLKMRQNIILRDKILYIYIYTLRRILKFFKRHFQFYMLEKILFWGAKL
jgi:hypothetical protein